MRKYNTILFDLDGTLLPMDQDYFTNNYFKLLVKKLEPYGHEAEEFIATIWAGVKAMVLNRGPISNEEAFWNCYRDTYGEDRMHERDVIMEFYSNEFEGGREFCGFNPKSDILVKGLKKKGYDVVLATNPIFPMVAQNMRMGWAGIDPADFSHITSYEDCHYCKPNPMYFEEVIKECNLDPASCLMVGNDVSEDMVAAETGMDVFLLTDCMINKEDKDIAQFRHGDMDALMEYLEVC